MKGRSLVFPMFTVTPAALHFPRRPRPWGVRSNNFTTADPLAHSTGAPQNAHTQRELHEPDVRARSCSSTAPRGSHDARPTVSAERGCVARSDIRSATRSSSDIDDRPSATAALMITWSSEMIAVTDAASLACPGRQGAASKHTNAHLWNTGHPDKRSAPANMAPTRADGEQPNAMSTVLARSAAHKCRSHCALPSITRQEPRQANANADPRCSLAHAAVARGRPQARSRAAARNVARVERA